MLTFTGSTDPYLLFGLCWDQLGVSCLCVKTGHVPSLLVMCESCRLCWLGFPHSHEKIEVLYQEGDIDRGPVQSDFPARGNSPQVCGGGPFQWPCRMWGFSNWIPQHGGSPVWVFVNEQRGDYLEKLPLLFQSLPGAIKFKRWLAVAGQLAVTPSTRISCFVLAKHRNSPLFEACPKHTAPKSGLANAHTTNVASDANGCAFFRSHPLSSSLLHG